MMNVIELFSGIGSQARALENIAADFKIVKTCEWDIHAIVAYDFIHNRDYSIDPEFSGMNPQQLKDELMKYGISSDGKGPMPYNTLSSLSDTSKRQILTSIKRTNNAVNIEDLEGHSLPSKIDIMTYSFPCQDLSNVGALHGYNKGIARDAGNRSCMLWQVERLLLERREHKKALPKFLLMENVTALLSERHKEHFQEWKNVLSELGYYNHIYRLRADDFGTPQTRYRVLMLSIWIGGHEKAKEALKKYFDSHNLMDANYRCGLGIEKTPLSSILKLDYSKKDYMKEALSAQPNDTPSRLDIWNDNLQITDSAGKILAEKVSTITTKQDRNPNSGNIYFDLKNRKSKYRFLTPRECMLLMGFSDEDYEAIIQGDCLLRKGNRLFSRDKIYHLAGNSIAVKVLEQIFKQIVEIRTLGIAATRGRPAGTCENKRKCKQALGVANVKEK